MAWSRDYHSNHDIDGDGRASCSPHVVGSWHARAYSAYGPRTVLKMIEHSWVYIFLKCDIEVGRGSFEYIYPSHSGERPRIHPLLQETIFLCGCKKGNGEMYVPVAPLVEQLVVCTNSDSDITDTDMI